MCKMRARLLREPNLSLEWAIDICRANKATTAQLKTLSTNVTTEESTEIQGIQRKPNEEQDRQLPCERCGSRHSHQFCPAQGAECYRCRRRNHFAKVYHTQSENKPRSRIYKIEQDKTGGSDDMFIRTLQKQKSKLTDWKVTVSLNKQRRVFKIDTGA